MADLAEPHLAIHARVLAARHVEGEALVARLLHVDGEGATAGPGFLGIDEGLEGRLAAERAGHLAALLDGRATHALADDLLGRGLAVDFLHGCIDVREELRLDAATLEHRHGLGG